MGCPGDSRFKTGYAVTALLCIFPGSRPGSFALLVYVSFHDDSCFVRQFTGIYEFQNINYSQGTVPHGFFVSPGASGKKDSTSESDAGGEKVRRHAANCFFDFRREITLFRLFSMSRVLQSLPYRMGGAQQNINDSEGMEGLCCY